MSTYCTLAVLTYKVDVVKIAKRPREFQINIENHCICFSPNVIRIRMRILFHRKKKLVGKRIIINVAAGPDVICMTPGRTEAVVPDQDQASRLCF